MVYLALGFPRFWDAKFGCVLLGIWWKISFALAANLQELNGFEEFVWSWSSGCAALGARLGAYLAGLVDPLLKRLQRFLPKF